MGKPATRKCVTAICAALGLLLYIVYTATNHCQQPLPSVGENTPQICTPREYLFYLKVPKTGSTTMAGILFRWAIRHNLTAVPVVRFPMNYGSESIIENCLVPRQCRLHLGQYNYFGEHYIYNDEEVKKLMHPDTTYIATLRDPMAQLRSLFEQNHLGSPGDPDPVRSMLENLPGSIPKRTRHDTQNQASHMFGLPVSANGDRPEDLARQRELLEFADTRYDLVLITEYMDESLVLLRRKMCWEMEDIVYLPLRVRQYGHKQAVLPVDLEEKHRQYSRSDYQLYGHFKEKLIGEINGASGKFRAELARFKRIINETFDFCVPLIEQMKSELEAGDKKRKHVNASSLFQKLEQSHLQLDPRPFGSPFAVTGLDCAFMSVDTRVSRLLVLVRQNRWLCRSKRKLFSQIPHWSADYCKDFHPRLGVSIKVMSKYSSYNLQGTKIVKIPPPNTV